MTTPERLRRRQRRESAFIAILAAGLCASVIYFNDLDDDRAKCLSSFIESDNDTSAIRSKLVVRESDATREIIREALTAKSREDILRARDEYFADLATIDLLRTQNPVEKFDPSVCGGSLPVKGGDS